jgi:hypothetical protein
MDNIRKSVMLLLYHRHKVLGLNEDSLSPVRYSNQKLPRIRKVSASHKAVMFGMFTWLLN